MIQSFDFHRIDVNTWWFTECMYIWFNFQWEDEDNADLPSDQDGVELGWFNDLYVFDTGTAWKITGKTNLFFLKN